ncbi:unnamed protein product [Nesidiocoris tenuis]|uniref:Uncharacterized protein n=1 Tax=Nesidiocoris tenuis TaxID=355587 RepID=A0A6H5GAJ7_9HEMI|nr:unnamed protein product [Nesidiocoris tenuis]
MSKKWLQPKEPVRIPDERYVRAPHRPPRIYIQFSLESCVSQNKGLLALRLEKKSFWSWVVHIQPNVHFRKARLTQLLNAAGAAPGERKLSRITLPIPVFEYDTSGSGTGCENRGASARNWNYRTSFFALGASPSTMHSGKRHRFTHASTHAQVCQPTRRLGPQFQLPTALIPFDSVYTVKAESPDYERSLSPVTCSRKTDVVFHPSLN